MFIFRSPVRISFSGGGTDMEVFYNTHGGAVLNATINKYFYSFYNQREDKVIQIISSDFQTALNVEDFYQLQFGEGFDIPVAVIRHFRINSGFDIFMASEVPPGSGLGSSGAVTVNLIKLCSSLKKENLSKKEIAEEAYFIQRNILKLPIGKQDEYASAFGGINFIEFDKNGVSVTPFKNEEIMEKLQKRLLLFFTGKTRKASEILSKQEEGAKNNSNVVEAMKKVKENCFSMKKALERGKLEEFGSLLDEAWKYKKKMCDTITNETIDELYETAKKNGALGGKLTGAGSGGYLMFFCEEKQHDKLINALTSKGLKLLDFKFDTQGVTQL